jgi:hypothetical protein
MNLTLGTFAETNRPVAQPEKAMEKLLHTIDGLNRAIPVVEARVDAELSGFGKIGVSSVKEDPRVTFFPNLQK